MVFSDDSAHAAGQAVRMGPEPGETEAVQMSGHHRNAGASVSQAGVVRYRISGAAAVNGVVELRAATGLVQKLNAAGADWAAPELTQTGHPLGRCRRRVRQARLRRLPAAAHLRHRRRATKTATVTAGSDLPTLLRRGLAVFPLPLGSKEAAPGWHPGCTTDPRWPPPGRPGRIRGRLPGQFHRRAGPGPVCRQPDGVASFACLCGEHGAGWPSTLPSPPQAGCTCTSASAPTTGSHR
jgi:hypothetical protein